MSVKYMILIKVIFYLINKNAGDRTRTCVGTKPIGPKPIPFDHSGTPAL